MNDSIGARMTYRPVRQHVLNHLRAEANVLGSWQQHGTLWPFDTGVALHAAVSALLLKGLNAEIGYVGAPRQYANLYGSPFFGTISLRYPGTTFRGIHTAYARVGYTYSFTPAYRLGAQIDLYSAHAPNLNALPWGFGLYLHVCPAFLIHSKR